MHKTVNFAVVNHVEWLNVSCSLSLSSCLSLKSTVGKSAWIFPNVTIEGNSHTSAIMTKMHKVLMLIHTNVITTRTRVYFHSIDKLKHYRGFLVSSSKISTLFPVLTFAPTKSNQDFILIILYHCLSETKHCYVWFS